MVDSLIKICHIIFFKYIFFKIIFFIYRGHGWWQAGSHSLTTQFNLPTYIKSSNLSIKSTKYLGVSWIKYGHVLYRLITRLNSYGSFFIFSSSYSSFLSTTTMDSGSHSLTTPSNLHQVIQPIDQINQIPKDAHGSSMVKFYINLSYDLALKS